MRHDRRNLFWHKLVMFALPTDLCFFFSCISWLVNLQKTKQQPEPKKITLIAISANKLYKFIWNVGCHSSNSKRHFKLFICRFSMSKRKIAEGRAQIAGIATNTFMLILRPFLKKTSTIRWPTNVHGGFLSSHQFPHRMMKPFYFFTNSFEHKIARNKPLSIKISICFSPSVSKWANKKCFFFDNFDLRGH